MCFERFPTGFLLVFCGVCACCVEINDPRSAVSVSHSLALNQQSSYAHQEFNANYHYAFPCDAYIMASIRINSSGIKQDMMMLKLLY